MSRDGQAHVRCVDGAVVLDYGAALYTIALLDVLEKLAESRYGAGPKAPFGALKNALNDAARELASVPRPSGTCAGTSDGAEPLTLVSEPVMTVKEVAELLSITSSGTTYLCRAGLLEASRFGRAWAISAASVSKYRANRRRKDAA